MKKIIAVLAVFIAIGIGIQACQDADASPVEYEAVNGQANAGTPYLQANSNMNQKAKGPNKIMINTVDASNKISLAGGSAVVEKSGEYLVVAAPQVGAKQGIQGVQNFRCWLAVNDVYVPNTNVLLNLRGWTKDVIVSQGVVSLEAGDAVSVYMDGGDDVFIEAIDNQPEGVLIPSIIFTMYKIN